VLSCRVAAASSKNIENNPMHSSRRPPMIGKALGLFKQIAPAATRIGFLFNPDRLSLLRGLSALVQGSSARHWRSM
jgi:hypothetical protein